LLKTRIVKVCYMFTHENLDLINTLNEYVS